MSVVYWYYQEPWNRRGPKPPFKFFEGAEHPPAVLGSLTSGPCANFYNIPSGGKKTLSKQVHDPRARRKNKTDEFEDYDD